MFILALSLASIDAPVQLGYLSEYARSNTLMLGTWFNISKSKHCAHACLYIYT
jgi:hypothetical protein